MKGFLSQKGVPFTEIDVSRDQAAAEEMVRKTGQMGVPVVDIDGNLAIGFDRAALERYLSQGATQKPFLGAAIADASRYMPGNRGAYVGAVKPGSTAEQAGLKQGDVIEELNGAPIGCAADLEKALSVVKKGELFNMKISRSGEARHLSGHY